LPEILDEEITPLTLLDTDDSLRLLITMLDPIMSWFSVLLMMIVYIFINAFQIVEPNMYIQTLILYLCMLAGFIFPWKLFMRIFEWTSSILYAYGLKWRPIIGASSLIVAVVIYYGLFFLVLFSAGPLFTRLYELFDPSMRILAQQFYIQHVQAYVPVLGFGFIYVIYDIVKQKIVYNS